MQKKNIVITVVISALVFVGYLGRDRIKEFFASRALSPPVAGQAKAQENESATGMSSNPTAEATDENKSNELVPTHSLVVRKDGKEIVAISASGEGVEKAFDEAIRRTICDNCPKAKSAPKAEPASTPQQSSPAQGPTQPEPEAEAPAQPKEVAGAVVEVNRACCPFHRDKQGWCCFDPSSGSTRPQCLEDHLSECEFFPGSGYARPASTRASAEDQPAAGQQERFCCQPCQNNGRSGVCFDSREELEQHFRVHDSPGGRARRNWRS